MQDWRVFQRFSDMREAEVCAALLKTGNIPVMIEDNTRIADKFFVGEDYDKNIQVKINFQDFETAHHLMAESAMKSIALLDEDYYLYSFSDTELIEVVAKPDEWGTIDYVLARQLLTQRGMHITDEAVDNFKEKRLANLSRPEDGLNSWATWGYGFLLFSVLITIWRVLSLWGLIACSMGIFVGWSLMHGKKTLPDGSIVFLYNERSRKHGRFIFWTGVVFTTMYLIFSLINLKRGSDLPGFL
ncbi:hypothetical protein [Foetidibacter luteolus]|uniref:hypothetical protein n=1 Tax=Foetidibacter luteolus TaxID=2608880 RepID=UPI00129A2B58|nr:hypothetical protein [Foetidibacter luteolus]